VKNGPDSVSIGAVRSKQHNIFALSVHHISQLYTEPWKVVPKQLRLS